MINIRMLAQHESSYHITTHHSAGGIETSPIALSLFDDVDEHNNLVTFEDSSFVFSQKASQQLICGCECEKSTPDARFCQNTQRWLNKFYQDKFQYVIYFKTYEGFLQSSPSIHATRSQIKRDVERTFQTSPYFRNKDV